MNVNKSLGLNLISSYSDDDSDTEEADSDLQSLETSCLSVIAKCKPIQSGLTSEVISKTKRLPLPSSIGQLFTNVAVKNKDPEDDPNMHNGRIRSFPHQRGNWSTYIYVPFEADEDFSDLISCLQTRVSRFGVELIPVETLHISLTRTVVLLHHWIDGFISSVRQKISHMSRFTVQLGALAVYCNEERTRTFLGLQAHNGSQQLVETTLALDQCLAEFRLPPFYKDPSFHMSVLWVVGDVQHTLEAMLPQLSSEMDSRPHNLHIDVSHCLCKTGNKTFTFPLAS